MSNALKKINAEIKRIKKKHPGKSHRMAQQEASRMYRNGKLGSASRSSGKKKKPIKKKAKTRPKQKRKGASVNINVIGSVASHLSLAKKALDKKLGNLVVRQFKAKKKPMKKKLGKQISAVKAQIKRIAI